MAHFDKALVIGDTHVGSKYALMPRFFRNYRANSVQRYILRKWLEMKENVGKIPLLIHVGDPIEGLGEKEKGKYVWTTDLDTQVECAAELVKMLDYDAAVSVSSSQYHSNVNPDTDKCFADQIGAKYDFEHFLDPWGDGRRIHVQHYIPVSSSGTWQYRTTQIAAELVAALLNQGEIGKISILIRGHAHYFVQAGYSGYIGYVNPCWKARDPYLARKGLKFIPKMGYTILYFNDDGSFDWDIKTFNILKPATTKIEVKNHASTRKK